MLTRYRHRKSRKSRRHSRKHQRTFRRKNRVLKKNSKKRRVMRGGEDESCNEYKSTEVCCKSHRLYNASKEYCGYMSCNEKC